MNNFPESLKKKLNSRLSEGNGRFLSAKNYPIDFYSNDYLGLSRNKLLRDNATALVEHYKLGNGSTGSRLISGESALNQDLEKYLSDFYKAEDTLVFNSGFNANIGLISAIALRKDVILVDELIHASIKDGVRLSMAKSYRFKHNDLESLKQKLEKFKNADTIYVLVESLYSMDGDSAPLKEIVELKKQYDFELIVDEAHSVGVHGEYGQGLVAYLNLESQCFARVVTFGKAIGGHGGAVLGSKILKSYLVNFSRPFIYTTGASPHQLAYLLAAHQYLKGNQKEIIKLRENIKYYHSKLNIKNSILNPIKTLEFESLEKLKKVNQEILRNQIGIKAIYSPTVPLGKERLRVCIHAYNSEDEIDYLISFI